MNDKMIVMPDAQPPASNGTSALATMPRSIFAMNQEHFDRLKFMAEMYAASAFNNGNEKLTKGDAFIIMMKGVELGLSPMVAMDFINVIKGKPTIDGKGMLALIRASGKAAYVNIDSQPTQCTVRSQRTDGGDEYVVTWTMERATQFKVYEKGNWIQLSQRSQWKSQPQVMLKWRAVAELAREAYSDVIGGLYTKEEIADNVTVTDDGDMQLQSGENDKPSLTSGKGGQSQERVGEGRRIEHWALTRSKMETFVAKAVELGLGETPKEAGAYLLAQWGEYSEKTEGITKLSQIPEDREEAQQILQQMADDLRGAVGASIPASPQGEPARAWTEGERLDVERWLAETLTETPSTFQQKTGQDIFSDPNADAAVAKALDFAAGDTLPLTVTSVTCQKQAVIFNVTNGFNAPEVRLYGGRSGMTKHVGDAYAAENKVSDWQPGQTYTLTPALSCTIERKDGKGGTYYQVVAIDAPDVSDVPPGDIPF